MKLYAKQYSLILNISQSLTVYFFFFLEEKKSLEGSLEDSNSG